MNRLILILLMILTTPIAWAQCNGTTMSFEHECARRLSTLDPNRNYSCRQLKEAQLFIAQNRLFEQRSILIKGRMDHTMDMVNYATWVIESVVMVTDIIDTLYSINKIYHNDDAEMTRVALNYVATGAADSVGLFEKTGLLPEDAGLVVDLVNDNMEVLIDYFVNKPPNIGAWLAENGDLKSYAIEKFATSATYLIGTHFLTNQTEELNGLMVGWMYLEAFYRQGGTFDGTGFDAHGAVAAELGLPENSQMPTVLHKIAEERGDVTEGFLAWFIGDDGYDIGAALDFVEDVKNEVRINLEVAGRAHLDLRSKRTWVVAGETMELGVAIQPGITNYYELCWNVRHGWVTGSADIGFTYHAPLQSIDTSNHEAMTEHISLTLSTGTESITKTVSFSLRNELHALVLSPGDEEGPALDRIYYRLNNESRWRRYAAVSALDAGSYQIEFRAVTGYQTPPAQSFVLPNPPLGPKMVIFDYNPESEVDEASLVMDLGTGKRNIGRWRVRDMTSWLVSGARVDLPLGAYDVEFQAVPGWVRPRPRSVVLQQAGEQIVRTANYEPNQASKASLGLDLVGGSPQMSANRLPFWRIKGDTTWRHGDYLYESLAPGAKTLTFRQIRGYEQPSNQETELSSGHNQAAVAYLSLNQQTFRVVGVIRDGRTPIGGVEVLGLPPGHASVFTNDSHGSFVISAPDGWQGELSFRKGDMLFQPAEVAVNVAGERPPLIRVHPDGTRPPEDRTDPTGSFLSPGPGDDLAAGEDTEIRWQADDDSGQIAVAELAYRSVLTHLQWVPLADNLEEVDHFVWSVPEHNGVNAELRLRITDVAGNTADVMSARFRISAGGACPTPNRSPVLRMPGSTTVRDYYRIAWTKVRGATAYRLQESLHADFSDPREFEETDTEINLRNRARDVYYYRVKAIGNCDKESSWSEARSLTVLANQPPQTPASPNPADDAENVPLAFSRLSWTTIDPDGDDVLYDVYFGKSEPLSKICSRTNTNFCDLDEPLEPGTAYFWRVVAYDSFGVRAEEVQWNFTSEFKFADLAVTALTPANDSPELESDLPLTVELINQGNDATQSTWCYFFTESTTDDRSEDLGRVSIPVLEPDESHTLQHHITLPDGFLGETRLVALVNRYNNFPEKDRDNNHGQALITIQDVNDPTLEIRWPRTGARFYTGRIQEFRWIARDDDGMSDFDLYYSIEGGEWVPIFEGRIFDYDIYEEWVTPDSFAGRTVQYRMVGRDRSGNSAEDLSDVITYTSGEEPEVAVISPHGGQLIVGEPFTFLWNATSSHGIEDVDLELFQNGIRVRTIARNIPNDGSYQWAPIHSMTNQNFVFAVEAKGLNGVKKRVMADGPFEVRDGFQFQPPWQVPQEIFPIPEAPPLPPDAWAPFGREPVWRQSVEYPRIVPGVDGDMHCFVIYHENIRRKQDDDNFTYYSGTHKLFHGVYRNGAFTDIETVIEVPYNTYDSLAEELDTRIAPTIGPDGRLHLSVVLEEWRTFFNGSSPDLLESNVFYLRQTDGGWSEPLNLSNTANVTSSWPATAVTPNGRAHVVWRDRVSGHSQIYYNSVSAAGTDSGAQMLIDHAWLPEMIADSTGRVHLMAQQSTPAQAAIYRQLDSGGWSEPQTAWSGSMGGHLTQLLTAPDGTLLFRVPQGDRLLILAKEDTGWTPLEYFIDDALEMWQARIFYDPHDNFRVLYYNRQITNRNVLVERPLYSDGRVGPYNFVDSPVGEAVDAEVAVATDGVVYAIWKDEVDLSDYEPILLNRAVYSNDSEAPVIVLQAPTGSESRRGGDNLEIRWSAQDNRSVTTVTLAWSEDGGLSFNTITQSPAATGAFNWTIPDRDIPELIVSAMARDANGNQGLVLSAGFPVSATVEGVVLTAPSGGESYQPGETISVAWDAAPEAVIRLEWSPDGGSVWRELLPSVTGIYSYDWTAPSIHGNQILIRVSAFDADSTYAVDTLAVPLTIFLDEAPFLPGSPSPPDQSGFIGDGALLTWSGGFPNPAQTPVYRVYFGTAAEPAGLLIETTQNQAAVPDLAQDTVYYWRVESEVNGTSVVGPVWRFATGSPNGLNAPRNLDFEAGETQVSLFWEDANQSVVGHDIERKGENDETFVTVAQLGGGTTDWLDTEVAANNGYVYRLRARGLNQKSGDVSPSSAEVHVQTANRAPLTPHSPTPENGGVTGHRPVMTWVGGDPDDDPVTYDLTLVDAMGSRVIIPELAVPLHNWENDLDASSVYHWQTVARDSHGAHTDSPRWSFKTNPAQPTAPEGLTALIEEERVALTWRWKPDPEMSLILERRLPGETEFRSINDWSDDELNSGQGKAHVDGEAIFLITGEDQLVTYRVGAVNEVGVQAWSEELTLSLDAFLCPVLAVLDTDAGICRGESVDLEVSLSGTPPWRLVWSDGLIQENIEQSPATRTVSPQNNTVYGLDTVRDFQCEGAASGQAEIVVRARPAATLSGDETVCAGETVTLSVDLSGNPPWRLEWSDGLIQDNIVTSPVVREVTLETSTVLAVTSVSDAFCSGVASGDAEVIIKPLPSGNLSGVTEICAGESAQLTISLTGTPPWRLEWSDGQIQAGITTSPVVRTVSPNETTTYRVIGVGDAFCDGAVSGNALVSVRVPPSALLSGETVYCLGGSSELSTSLTGTPPWRLEWSDGLVQDNITTSPVIREVALETSGVIAITSINDAFCSGMASGEVEVIVNPTPTANLSGAMEICVGESAALTFHLSGTPPWRLAWSDGLIQEGITTSPAVRTVSPETTTSYMLTSVRDAVCDGTAVGSAQVLVNARPTAALAGDVSHCLGGSSELAVNLSGTPPWRLEWSDGVVQEGLTTTHATRTVSSESSTLFAVTAVSDAHCSGEASGEVTVTVHPEPVASLSGDRTICVGEQVEIEVTLSGTPPWRLEWSDGIIQEGIDASPALRTVAPGLDTAYTLTAISDAHCSGNSPGGVMVTVETPPSAALNGEFTICTGESIELNVDLTGIPPWRLTWSDGFVQEDVQTPSAKRVVSPDSSTSYALVSVADANCSGSASGHAEVVVRMLPTAALPENVPLCAGETATLSIDLTGTPPWRLEWSDGFVQDSITSSPATRMVSPESTSTYELAALSDSFCQGVTSGSTVVMVHSVAQATVSGDAEICLGEDTTLSVHPTGTPPWSLTWSDGFSQDEMTVAPITRTVAPEDSTTFSLAAFHDGNCGGIVSGQAEVLVGIPPVITVQPEQNAVCEGEEAVLAVSVADETPLTYQWFKEGIPVSGAVEAEFIIAEATLEDTGMYRVEVTGACGAVVSELVELQVETTPSILNHPEDRIACVDEAISLSVVASGNEPLTYQWFKADQIIEGAVESVYEISAISTGDAGVYRCRVVNTCGETTSMAANLAIRSLPTIVDQPIDRAVCPGDTVQFALVVQSEEPVDYQWYRDGVLLVGAQAELLSLEHVSAADAGVYDCEVISFCGVVMSDAANLEISGDLWSETMPESQALGLDPPVFHVTVDCAEPEVVVSWTAEPPTTLIAEDMSVMLEPPPAVTTIVSAHITDGQGQATTSQAILLVPTNPGFEDFNNDGCNDIVDLWTLMQFWLSSYTGDPNDDGNLNLLDLMYLNISELEPCAAQKQ